MYDDSDEPLIRAQLKERKHAREKRKAGDDPKRLLDEEEKKEKARQAEQHPPMIGFDLPCRVCLLGGTGAGKTYTFVHDMLTNPDCMRGKFRVIICFSPTMKRDPAWMRVFTESKGFRLYEYYDDDIMRRIYKEQEYIFEHARELAEPILVFIDDNAYGTREAKNHEWLDRTHVSGRHIDISVVTCIQKKHMLSPVQCEQLSNLLLWCTASAKSVDSVHEQMGAMIDKKQFIQMFCEITSEKYKYMHIRKCKDGGVMQVWDGLDKCVVENVNSITAMQKLQKLNRSYGNAQGPQNPPDVTLKTPSQS